MCQWDVPKSHKLRAAPVLSAGSIAPFVRFSFAALDR
jgi:hypothetical protein